MDRRFVGRSSALIVACGDGEEGKPLEIRDEHAQWACAVVMTLVQGLGEAVANNVGDNKNDRDRKRVLKIITKRGATGITKRDLTRATQWSNRRQRTELTDELLEAELIYYSDKVKTYWAASVTDAPYVS